MVVLVVLIKFWLFGSILVVLGNFCLCWWTFGCAHRWSATGDLQPWGRRVGCFGGFGCFDQFLVVLVNLGLCRSIWACFRQFLFHFWSFCSIFVCFGQCVVVLINFGQFLVVFVNLCCFDCLWSIFGCFVQFFDCFRQFLSVLVVLVVFVNFWLFWSFFWLFSLL